MPQPEENQQDAAELIAGYESAQRTIDDAIGLLAADPLRAQNRQKHRDIRLVADVALAGLGGRTARWTAGRLPGVAARGASAAAAALPGVAEAGVDPDRIVAELVDELVQALARAVSTTSQTTAAMLRTVAADRALTAAVAARDVDAALTRIGELAEGVHAVRYANGTRMPLGAYASMLIRTVTARAYNVGTLETARAHGVGAVQVADGLGCQWPTGHGHPPAADGMVVSVDLADQYQLAHPHCQRGYLLRPDITDPAALDDGELDIPEPTPAAAVEQATVRTVVRATLRRYAARLEARRRRLETRRTARR